MRLITLGRLELEGTSFQRAKSSLLLAYLSLQGRQPREHLAELFWRGGTPRQRRNNLSKTLSDLRKHAPGSFGADSTNVWSLVSTDAGEFWQALEAGDHAGAAGVYAGPFFAGHLSGWGAELEEWLFEQRDRLAAGAQEALLSLAEQMVERSPGNALGHARSAFRLTDPEVEVLPRFYALFRGRDVNLAREVRDVARGYGVTPQSIFEGAARRERAGRDGVTTPHDLPTGGTSFVGRGAELGNITRRLLQPDCSVLSLIGVGGAGKSRLAAQAAHELLKANRFRDGIYFVRLDALSNEGLIPGKIADHLGLSLTSRDVVEELGQHIGAKKLLLVLDNFEHLTEGASLIPRLLNGCPHLKIFVTSRERLNLEEEWVFPVAGLALPDDTSDAEDARYADAVRLFVQRSTKTRLTFTLGPAELPHVLELCRLVAGSPLALELAAAWTKVMSLEELTREVERNLDVLRANPRCRSERHASLRAVFEHSWALLTPDEQAALKKTSVFRGGFTKEAAAAVAETSLGLLAALVDKSLLRVLPSGRYDRHPLLCQYTQEKLEADGASMGALKERHLAYFLALAESAEPHLSGPEQKGWLDRLERDHANFREALTYALTRDAADTALRLSGALWWFWYVRGYYTEGRGWLDRALELAPSAPTLVRARALKGAGTMAVQQSDYEVGRDHLNASLAVFQALERPEDVAASLNNLASISYHLRDYAVAAAHFREAAAIYESLGDKWHTAGVLTNLGRVVLEQGDLEGVRAISRKSLQLTRCVADEGLTARTLVDIGRFEAVLGNHALARDLYQRGLGTLRDLDYKISIADALGWLGDLERREGNSALARFYYEETVALQQALGLERGLVDTIEAFAYLGTDRGEWQRASQLLGAADSLRDTLGLPRMVSDEPEFARFRKRLINQLSEPGFCSAYDRGATMTLEQVVSYALEAPTDVQSASEL